MLIVNFLLLLLALAAAPGFAAPLRSHPSPEPSLKSTVDATVVNGRRFPTAGDRTQYHVLEVRSNQSAQKGMKHKMEGPRGPPGTIGFHPVPENQIYRTPNGVYTGKEINKHAAKLVAAIPHADNFHKKKRPNGYPKPGTGFGADDPENPWPNNNAEGRVSYHFPIHPKAFGKTVLTGKPGKAGTDRLIGYRSGDDNKLHLAVSYHDTKKPLKAAQSGQTAPTDHPASIAHPQRANKLQIKAAKAKFGVSHAWKRVKNQASTTWKNTKERLKFGKKKNH